ncbi:hypothetical protein [Oceanobacillus kimchii]|uniref:Uncharacterized protein n=1 Tax=Oceanobacillus kimchii TaxID=746691 RepID=A0ABQ5TH69_9BACI|nr:hypothetical protein [Oceanobacillus kimchii]GLO66213.1 hypothetical protein MACH08_19970 [Oceanobacillus kimchii]
MKIKGWVYEDANQNEYEARYKFLKEKNVYIYSESVQTNYGRKTYSGVVIDDGGLELSTLDIGLICDSGNLCFGGTGNFDGKRNFNFTVYTD